MPPAECRPKKTLIIILLALKEEECIETVLGVAEHLLDNAADPNVLDEEGVSALTRAVLLGSSEVMEFLLEAGADPNQTSDNTAIGRDDEFLISPAHACFKQEGKLLVYN